MQRRIIPICVLLFTILAANPAFAHKVRIFAWGEGDTIHTESRFSGGRAARNSTVTVIDTKTGDEILQGTTDESGLFNFKQPEGVVSMDIVINSGDGHKNSWRYEVETTATEPTVPTKPAIAEKATEQAMPTHKAAPVALPSGLTKSDLAEIIDERLEAKLAPIRKMLAENEDHSPSVQDILGGIGYILGLAGLAAYMKSNKQ